MQVFAFAKVSDDDARNKVYKSVKQGKSRFGWSGSETDDLREEWNGKQNFLLGIKKDDWIVHVNMPQYGECVALKVAGEYEFDNAGLECNWGRDFRHVIPVDPNSIIEFNRRDPNILPTVNLNPRGRYHRVKYVLDFEKSITNLKENRVDLKNVESKEIFHLNEKTDEIMKQLTSLLHNTHKGKELERFLAKVFRKVENVVEVNENGFGWGTDHGADLIVHTQTNISNIEFENKIIIQVKSFEGEHYDLSAIDQVITGIDFYNADAGIIITTANSTEELEGKIQEVAEKIKKPIDLIAGNDVAKFVIKYGKDLLFNLK